MLDKVKLFLHKIQLKNKQRIVKDKFEKEGLTDDVLEQQVEINTLRRELDLPDDSEFIHGEFVQ
ncbi:hypothetical protein [Methanobrevibacter sp.]|uniref:hypothetical protein n=1 Tax=Methanobrevibacter sp. TaxID=66852 RepID=UPI00388DFC9B